MLFKKNSQGVEHSIKKWPYKSNYFWEKWNSKVMECSTDEELSKTERGSKGFGSTGK